MCLHANHKENKKTAREKRFNLASFFEQNWDAYVKSPNHYITPEQYKAVAAMRACRTEALGIDHYVCDQCGEISQVYHSCKNRFCPTCSWKDTMQWAEKIKEQMLVAILGRFVPPISEWLVPVISVQTVPRGS